MAGIFKAYDIRGVYGEELDEGIAYLVGRAVVTYTGATSILVGNDMRVSSPSLKEALVRGITDQGADVVDFGLCSTPMFYWATQKYAAGVMVTASHNPAKFNGFKMCKDGAFPIGEISGMQDVERIVLEQDFPTVERKGSVSTVELLNDYISFNLSFLKTDKPFKVVIDAGNGMGGYTYGALAKRLPSNVEIIPMWFELDGNFPNHEANPLKIENCEALMRRVKLENADFGVSLDGDEDRIFFIDNNGEYIASDFTTALIAEQVLSEKPGVKIHYGINHSRIVPEIIHIAGGVPIMNRCGHAFYKVNMKETGAAFGGEHSGHYFNAEVQNAEDTQIIFFRMLNLLAQEDKSIADLVAPMKRYAKTPEINFTVQGAKDIISRLQSEYAGEPARDDFISYTTMDGLRVDFEDWWFCVRASNTEPLLRLNMEAKDQAMLDQKFEELKGKITG